MPHTELTRRRDGIATPLLGAALVGAGIVLLYERTRADGIARLWPLFLVALGVAGVGLGLGDEPDEAWWLIGTGFWLLINAAGDTLARLGGPLVVIVAGLIALRGALAHAQPFSPRGDSHAE